MWHVHDIATTHDGTRGEVQVPTHQQVCVAGYRRNAAHTKWRQETSRLNLLHTGTPTGSLASPLAPPLAVVPGMEGCRDNPSTRYTRHVRGSDQDVGPNPSTNGVLGQRCVTKHGQSTTHSTGRAPEAAQGDDRKLKERLQSD